MEKIRLTDVIKSVGGQILNLKYSADDIYIDSISIDSRNIKTGSLFVPIVGEHFDGHDFIKQSIDSGAVCALTQKTDENTVSNCTVIYVKDTVKALGDIARFYISQFKNLSIVAITGSVGKTTTKDMIASVLEQKFNVLKTEGNFNNEIGLPLTLFNLKSEHDIAVVEMGMSQFGEIEYLSSIAKPHIAVITNIGVSHIENLGSREGILKAKSEIFQNLNGTAILNSDDDMLIILKDRQDCDIKWFGIENKADIYADNIESLELNGIKCTLHTQKFELNVTIPSPGKHIVYAAMAATAVAQIYCMNPYQIKTGIENFIPTKMRMNIKKFKNQITLIDDVYNASPQSMTAAIDVLKNSGNSRKVAVLGDMYEIGEQSYKMHFEVGKYAVNSAVDLTICVGKFAEYMYRGAYENKSSKQTVVYFENQQELENNLLALLKKYDIILVKASRGMHLEKTVDKIEKVELQ